MCTQQLSALHLSEMPNIELVAFEAEIDDLCSTNGYANEHIAHIKEEVQNELRVRNLDLSLDCMYA